MGVGRGGWEGGGMCGWGCVRVGGWEGFRLDVGGWVGGLVVMDGWMDGWNGWIGMKGLGSEGVSG